MLVNRVSEVNVGRGSSDNVNIFSCDFNHKITGDRSGVDVKSLERWKYFRKHKN